jgi:hypothetical protein
MLCCKTNISDIFWNNLVILFQSTDFTNTGWIPMPSRTEPIRILQQVLFDLFKINLIFRKMHLQIRCLWIACRIIVFNNRNGASYTSATLMVAQCIAIYDFGLLLKITKAYISRHLLICSFSFSLL